MSSPVNWLQSALAGLSSLENLPEKFEGVYRHDSHRVPPLARPPFLIACAAATLGIAPSSCPELPSCSRKPADSLGKPRWDIQLFLMMHGWARAQGPRAGAHPGLIIMLGSCWAWVWLMLGSCWGAGGRVLGRGGWLGVGRWACLHCYLFFSSWALPCSVSPSHELMPYLMPYLTLPFLVVCPHAACML